MIESVTRENLDEYEAFVSRHARGSFLQSCLWARQKPMWRWRAMLRRNEYGRITGTLAVLIRKTPLLGRSIVYGCRGPVCDSGDTETLRELMEALKKLAQREHAYLVRLDPAVPAADAGFLAAMASAGFGVRKRRRSYVPMQNRRVWRIDFTGRIPERAFDDYDAAHQQGVRIALQRGVTVQTGGQELLDDFMQLLQQRSLREARVMRPREYFAGLLGNFGDEARIFLAYYEKRPVAGALTIQYGGRCSSVFEADDAEEALRARYLLRTVILRQAIADGCSCCEFAGLPRDPHSREYQFVQGCGGTPVTYAGELDLVLRPVTNFFAELGGAVLRRINRQLYFVRVR